MRWSGISNNCPRTSPSSVNYTRKEVVENAADKKRAKEREILSSSTDNIEYIIICRKNVAFVSLDKRGVIQSGMGYR